THAPAGGVSGGRRRSGPHARNEAQLRHVDEALRVQGYLARPGHVRPLPKISSRVRKQLDAAILAVGDVDGPIPAHSDAVGYAELSRSLPRLAPGEQQTAF